MALPTSANYWFLFRIVNNLKQIFLLFTSMRPWNCLLWIIFCYCFSPWNSKAVRPYFSSDTVEGMKNKPWWSRWRGCLFSYSVWMIPLLLTPVKWNLQFQSLLVTPNKIVLQEKNENSSKSLRPRCYSLDLSWGVGLLINH